MEHLQVLAEGKPLHVVEQGAAAQVGRSFVDVQDGRAGEDDVQPRMVVVYQFQFACPILVFMYFVNDEVTPSPLDKVIGQVYQVVAGEIEVVGIDKERRVALQPFLGMLQHQRGFSYAAWPYQSHQTVLPVYAVEYITVVFSGGIPQQNIKVGLQFLHFFSFFGGKDTKSALNSVHFYEETAHFAVQIYELAKLLHLINRLADIPRDALQFAQSVDVAILALLLVPVDEGSRLAVVDGEARAG